jgi:hypothetical protein
MGPAQEQVRRRLVRLLLYRYIQLILRATAEKRVDDG